MKIEGATG